MVVGLTHTFFGIKNNHFGDNWLLEYSLVIGILFVSDPFCNCTSFLPWGQIDGLSSGLNLSSLLVCYDVAKQLD